MAQDPLAAKYLSRGLIEQFVPIQDRDYDDLRVMTTAVQEAEHEVLLS